MNAQTIPLARFGAVDAATGSVVDLVAHDWQAAKDYARFVAALHTAGSSWYVSMNEMRRLLSNAYGLTIEPRRYSGFYRRACKDGILRWDEADPHCYEVNDDLRGHYRGKPQRRYRLAQRPGDDQ